MNYFNEWSEGVTNRDDFHIEHYWDSLEKTIKRPGNLLDMQQMLRDVTWKLIRCDHLKESDGHVMPSLFVNKCRTMAEKCTTNAVVSLETARQQFNFGLLGTGLSEAWRKE